jgi:nicotinamide riboside kinase
MAARVIAILGAESTGKSTLARELTRILRDRGMDAALVPEYLRHFCEVHGRTPSAHEQAAIAQAQREQIAQARAAHAIVLADTTALMTAVYSHHLFQDRSLYAQALSDHRDVDATLLMSLDLAWTADGIQRDGPHVREPVDSLIRNALQGAGLGYSVVAGHGIARMAHALSVIEHLLDEPARQWRANMGRSGWRWFCDHCDDGECEQHALLRDG